MNRVGKPRIVYSLIVLLLCLIVANCNRIIEHRKHYHYKKGMQLFNNEEYSAAAEEFENALQFDKRYFDALYMCGISYNSMGKFSPAISFLKRAALERPEDIQVKLKIGECLLHNISLYKSRPVRAKIALEELRNYFSAVMLPLADQNRDVRIWLLKYYLEQNKLIEAGEIIEGFLSNGDKAADFYAVLVQFNLKKNNISEAEAVVLKHFSHTPEWMKTIELVITQFKSAGNYDALEKIYIKIMEQVEEKLPYQKALAKLYRLRGEGEKEDRMIRTMLNDYPDMVEIKRDYVNFLNYLNRQSQAEAFVNDELNKQPQNVKLQKLLVDIYAATGQMQKASLSVEKIISTTPEEDKSWAEFNNILADINFKKGEYKKSKKNAEEILSKYPRDRDARFLLCKLYIQEGKALPAIGELRLLVSENPTVAEYSYYLGLAHEMRGENALAEKAFRSALDCSSDYKDALKKWIAIYPKTGSLSEAEIRIKKYLDIHPEDTEIKTLQQTIQEQKTGIITSANATEK